MSALSGCTWFGQEESTPDTRERDTEVTIEDSDDDGSEGEPTTVEAASLVSAHVEALDSVGYRSETTVTDVFDDERVSKEIGYAETVDRSAFEVVETTTQRNGIREITFQSIDLETTTTVTLDSGREFSFDSSDEFSNSGLALRVTGESVFKQFLMGATLRLKRRTDASDAQSNSESGESPIREYEFTDHDHYSLTSGELRINSRDVIEMFTIEWQANDVEKAISVQMTNVGSIQI